MIEQLDEGQVWSKRVDFFRYGSVWSTHCQYPHNRMYAGKEQRAIMHVVNLPKPFKTHYFYIRKIEDPDGNTVGSMTGRVTTRSGMLQWINQPDCPAEIEFRA